MYCDTLVKIKLMYSVSKFCTFHDNSLCLHYKTKIVTCSKKNLSHAYDLLFPYDEGPAFSLKYYEC